MALRVKQDNFEEEVIKSQLPVVAEFYSDSCIPCKQLSVTLSELEEDYSDQIKFVKINVNFDSELTEKYHVMASPTTLFFKEGNEVKRVIGIVKKNVMNEIIDNIL